jgi:hypothetical protein
MDCNAESLAGLRRAAVLAGELRVELAGLFLEDINLLRMSELPGHEISLASGTGKSTSRVEMERQMRRSANAAKEEVARLAQALSLSWTFEVRRASMDQALREAAKTEELVCSVLASPFFPTLKSRPARQNRGAPTNSILAIFENGERGGRVLELAARAARVHGLPLEVLVPARDAASGAKAVAKAGEVLGKTAGKAVSVTTRRLPLSEAAIVGALTSARGQLLFLDAGGKIASIKSLATLRSAINCDVLLVSS